MTSTGDTHQRAGSSPQESLEHRDQMAVDASTGGASEHGLLGLVIDWGGVLTASLDGAIADWAARDSVAREHLREVLIGWSGPVEAADRSPLHQVERGELGTEAFEELLAQALSERGSQVEPQGLVSRMLHAVRDLDARMIKMLRQVRAAGVRTALLSNSWGEHYPPELFDDLFDAVVISGRVGMRKPEPEIFTLAANQLGLAPSNCVMVDDMPRNIRAAVDVGMVGVVHHTVPQTLAELEVLLGIELTR